MALTPAAGRSENEQKSAAPADAAIFNRRWVDRSPHESRFATLDGIKLHYLDWGGSGPTLLFLHGLGDTAHIFDDIAPAFSDRLHVLGLNAAWRPARIEASSSFNASVRFMTRSFRRQVAGGKILLYHAAPFSAHRR